MSVTSKEAAFPSLDSDEMNFIRSIAKVQDCRPGDTIIKAGDPDIDFIVVEVGAIDILNPIDNNRLIVTHKPGEFVGDIDLLTRRPIIVTAIAQGAQLRILLASPVKSSANSLTPSPASPKNSSPPSCERPRSFLQKRPPPVGLPCHRPRLLQGHQCRPRIPLQKFRAFRLVRLRR